MSFCDGHRGYLSAIADGELGMVPPATLAHVARCPGCRDEVDTQRRLTRLLARAARGAAWPRVRWRWAAAVLAAGIVAAVVTVAPASPPPGEGDPVAAALSVAGRPPQLRTTDPARLEAWCAREAERPVPDVSTSWLTPAGARMDRYRDGEIVTVTYVVAARGTVRVSWFDSAEGGGGERGVQARLVRGATVLLVRSGSATAVVSGTAPPDRLREAAARIEAAAAAGAEAPRGAPE